MEIFGQLQRFIRARGECRRGLILKALAIPVAEAASPRVWPTLWRQRAILCRPVKFALVGISGVGVDTLALYLLHGVAGVPLFVAAPIAYEVAVANNYLWNDLWTFGTRSPSLVRLLKFNAVSLGAFAITLTALFVLKELAGVHYLIANLLGIGLGFFWNFTFNVLWTWRARPTVSADPYEPEVA